MKHTQSGFINIVVSIIIVLVVIGVGTYFYSKNRIPSPTEHSGDITMSDNEPAGKCGLNITNLSSNQKVSWPLIIKGTVDMKHSSDDCAWQTSEGVAGTAQFYIYLTEKNDEGKIKGWTSIGKPVFMNLEKIVSDKGDFTVSFYFPEGGFQENAPIKIVFAEENPAAIRPSLTFELPLVLE